MARIETLLSVLLLGTPIWASVFEFPRAKREHDGFGVFCSLLTALVALIIWLLIGVGTHS